MLRMLLLLVAAANAMVTSSADFLRAQKKDTKLSQVHKFSYFIVLLTPVEGGSRSSPVAGCHYRSNLMWLMKMTSKFEQSKRKKRRCALFCNDATISIETDEKKKTSTSTTTTTQTLLKRVLEGRLNLIYNRKSNSQ